MGAGGANDSDTMKVKKKVSKWNEQLMPNVCKRSNMNKKGLLNMFVIVASMEHQNEKQTRNVKK